MDLMWRKGQDRLSLRSILAGENGCMPAVAGWDMEYGWQVMSESLRAAEEGERRRRFPVVRGDLLFSVSFPLLFHPKCLD